MQSRCLSRVAGRWSGMRFPGHLSTIIRLYMFLAYKKTQITTGIVAI